MAFTQVDIARQMVAQLRLLDPGISAEVGTPERKITDTVAAALADAQVDLTGLQGALDINALFGSNLDAFLSIFGFGRQQATAASGFVTFSIITPATTNIRVPANTQVVAHNVTIAPNTISDITYYTISDVILQAGATSVVAPIRATNTGVLGNIDANTITDFLGQPPPGIVSVNNDAPVVGGVDQESDNELKVRFQNTVFRNLAGTEDQYLAQAISTAFTTRANVVGPVSKYQEYVQVPPVDDASAYDINGDGVAEAGNGIAGEYTTALSTVPYSQYVYSSVPIFVSSGQFSDTQNITFYTRDIDFRFNTDPDHKNLGDTYRMYNLTPVDGITPNPIGGSPYVYPGTVQPNLTFINVYTGFDTSVTAVKPNDLMLFEHQYVSSASRNDPTRNITNAVDVFIDGQNPTAASTVLPVPGISKLFVNNPASVSYFANYRRVGTTNYFPVIGNILTPLYFQPVLDLPDTIEVTVDNDNYVFFKGIHYWAVEDVSSIGRSVRARSGIEWSTVVGAKTGNDLEAGPYSGPIVSALPSTASIHIDNYQYDANVSTLQATLEANKQITTDVLVHQAETFYIKLDVSVMYNPGISANDVNNSIYNALTQALSGLPFGSPVQLSDLLQAIHNTAGVDNVRWSTDTPVQHLTTRVYQTDSTGRPLTNVVIDRRRAGTSVVPEIQQLYVTGSPTGGSYTITFNGNQTAPIPYNAASGELQSALNASPVNANVSVTGSGSPFDPFVITFVNLGSQSLLSVDAGRLTGGPRQIAEDFFLQDNQVVALPQSAYVPPSGLPDTLPGLIIRVRAANTWVRS